jgi:hypothetical protein
MTGSPLSLRTCRGCGITFLAPSVGSRLPGYGRYCTRTCAFWGRVDRSDPDGCWLWTGPVSKGYGVFHWGGEQAGAHQEAWRQAHGPIPDGLWVLHACPGAHDPLCVRHLYLGTHADNTADAVAQGQMRRGDQHGLRLHPERVARGESHGSARLTVKETEEIRVAVAGGETQRAVARRYGVSFQQVSKIVRGQRWAS